MTRTIGENLRRRAERLVTERALDPGTDGDGAGVRQLLQELCVHQAELEIQNEELRDAQQALEASRRQYMQLFESVPAACFAVDSGGIIESTNRRAETLFGIGRRRLRGRPLLLMVERRDHGRLLSYLEAVRAGGDAGRDEFRFRRLDGSGFDGMLDATDLRDAATGKSLVLCGVVDVTARNHATEGLRLAKLEVERANAQLERALATKTKFLAAASHDLRQPVQALALFVDVLSHQGLSGPSEAIVARVNEAVVSLGALLNGLLDISKIEAGLIVPDVSEFRSGDILQRLTAEFSALATSKGLRFKSLQRDETLRSDPTLLERILRNMLSNAIRYTQNGGIVFGCRRREGVLRIEVWDTGVGVPPDQLEMIFDDFHQVGNEARNREEGLGLGLAIVARLARLLDCRIDVRSRVGRGSCFAVEVPLAADLVEPD